MTIVWVVAGLASDLHVLVAPVDTPDMIDTDLDFMPDHPAWQPVLRAYLTAQESLLEERRTASAVAGRAAKSAGSSAMNASGGATLTMADDDESTDLNASTDPVDPPAADELSTATTESDEHDDSSGDDADDDDESGSPRRRGKSASGSKSGTPWVPRMRVISGVDREDLSRVHGQLIAFGLLKCDVVDREAGMIYQVTPEGRQMLERAAAIGTIDDAASDDAASDAAVSVDDGQLVEAATTGIDVSDRVARDADLDTDAGDVCGFSLEPPADDDAYEAAA